MKHTIQLLSAAFLGLVLMTGCSKKDDPASSSSKDAFIQIDDKKNAPVTQKADPYNRGQVNSCFFGSTKLDLTVKVGVSEVFVQTILEYSVPNKSKAEGDVLAKSFFDGIAEGATIDAKILGYDSNGTGTGFVLTGSVSATTGVWDYSYNEQNDMALEISKVNGKIQFAVNAPVNLSLVKRAGAGDVNYPSFTATSMFSLQIERK